MIFSRKRSLDSILAGAEQQSLRRSLGPLQLTLFGVGCIIGTGIFVLTAAGAQKAGPGIMLAFLIAGAVCVFAALCYAEIASMVPVAGSAYTYTYAVFGEFVGWTVGWALILEYGVAASAVSVGWSGYFTGTVMEATLGVAVPASLKTGPLVLGGGEGGFINLPAFAIALAITWLLMVGTRESARVNAFLVLLKVVALLVFIGLALPAARSSNFEPFLPAGLFGGFGSGVGAVGAAATMFFAFVGFDAVSTAAEETRNPQRDLPIGVVGSLAICALFYILVAAAAVGAIGGQPIFDSAGLPLQPGSEELARQCSLAPNTDRLVCSNEALAHVLRQIGFGTLGNTLGLAAFVALPSVVLVLLFGQTRVLFAMSRDGLLPPLLSEIHPTWKTPHRMTALTGVAVATAAAFLPIGKLADIANSGTLYAFFMVALAVMFLRTREPDRKRGFRVRGLIVVAPLAMAGSLFLFVNLPYSAMLMLPIWTTLGVLVYFSYGYRKSQLSGAPIETERLPRQS